MTATSAAPPQCYPYNPPATPILTILFYDAHIVGLVKSSGLLSVPGKGPDRADCLLTRAQPEFPDATIVHRLDMDTSGVMVLARNADAHRNLSRQFETRRVVKAYVARVWGEIQSDRGVVDAPLIRDWPNRPRQIIDFENGRAAVTRWQVIGRDAGVTRIRLHPETGRTHQLRVHMASLGHPILGDNLYAGADALSAAGRLQLHASTLTFEHPSTGEVVTLEDACPF